MKSNDLKLCGECFLEKQGQLFDEPVVENLQEAMEFLDDVYTEVFQGIRQVREYLDELGMDVSGMSNEDIEGQMEVFRLPDGRYFVVEG